MPTALVSRQFVAGYGDKVKAVVESAGKSVEFITPPEEKGARLSQADCDRIDCAFIDRATRSNDQCYAAFDAAVVASKAIRWLHVNSSGVNPAPHVSAVAAKGGTITSSTGANAEPVSQTAFTGLLMLARGFPTHVRNQAQRQWQPLRGAAIPDDLRGQTVVTIGLGAVGSSFACYARAFGLKVVAVRRSPMKPGDPADEMYPPSQLNEVLPRADWLMLTCPLTPETRNLVNADTIGRMKKGARLINVSRGEVIDEAAVIEALRSGQLGGAYIDPFTVEPLPKDSPFWDLPNVIVTPHNAAASNGNEKRVAEIFVANFGRWVRGEPLANLQRVS